MEFHTRVAYFGGSFNPPHVGHAMIVSWVLWTGLAEEVWLAPTTITPSGRSWFPTKIAWPWSTT